ncbi:MAG: adenosylmethionine--8-amino-7-oxononanoate transaminase [Phycisphaerae bacterium]
MARRAADQTAADAARLGDWDRRYLWHPFTQHRLWNRSDPLIIVAGEGEFLIDADGRRYIDGVASLWCNVHGHNHPHINRAIRRQLDQIAHCTLLGLTSPAPVLLAKRLVELAPAGLTRVFFSDDGSTAVEVACKMALAYWQHRGQRQRNRFIALENAYHGDTLGAVSLGGIATFGELYRPLLFETHRAVSPYCYRCRLGLQRGSCNLACAEAVGQLLERHRGRVAAVVVEPLVQCAGGIITAPPGYLGRIRQLCDQHDVLLIADEVATGFGRTGSLFACQQEEVCPDLLCLAKALTGGYLPLAATLTTEQIYQAFLGEVEQDRTFYHGHTYTGNALGCAAALANLELFEQEQTLRRLPAKIDRMGEHLKRIAELEHVGDVRQCGLIAGIELVADRASKAGFARRWQVGARVCMHARRYGVILRPLADVIVLFPPLAISLESLDRLMEVTARCIREVVPQLQAVNTSSHRG